MLDWPTGVAKALLAGVAMEGLTARWRPLVRPPLKPRAIVEAILA